jgi:hypothetical protein
MMEPPSSTKVFFLTSYRSPASGSLATHYINATAIQTQAKGIWNYIGCFQDGMWVDQRSSPAQRTLDGISFDWSDYKTMTNQQCADLCGGLGYSHFGTEFCWCQISFLPLTSLHFGQTLSLILTLNILDAQCFCGNNINLQASLIGQKNCSTPCDGNKTEACGGIWTMSIFQSNSPMVHNLLLPTLTSMIRFWKEITV